MFKYLRAIGRASLAPSFSDVCSPRCPVGRDASDLNRVPQAVVVGFEWGMERDPSDMHARLAIIAPDLRGFVVEGAAMAYTIRDRLPGSYGPSLAARWLDMVPEHLLLAYIGVGFAAARLPRGLWSQTLPSLPAQGHHPRMSWLIVDGLGFDWGYFRPEKWVDSQSRPRGCSWMGDELYFPRAFDQGLGRALWFLYGAAVPEVARQVARFHEGRQADLWAGVGLAASVARGADRNELDDLVVASGTYWPELALGATFAAVALSESGHVPEASVEAIETLTGHPLSTALEIARSCEPQGVRDIPGLPVYEVWRDGIRSEWRSKGRSKNPSEVTTAAS